MPYGTQAKEAALRRVLNLTGGPTIPATLYAGLHRQDNAADTDDVLGNEATIGTGGYVRVSVANGSGLWTFSAPDGAESNTVITWPQSTAAWSSGALQLNQVALHSAATGGSMWLWVPLQSGVTVATSGIDVAIQPGDLSLTQLA